MDKIIVIDGYIGQSAYSKQFIRAMLDGTKGKMVLIKVSSLGGSVDHALDIHNQIAEHGNITTELSGFVASSATLISLGSKKTRIADNSLYLIHKPLGWVDIFGYFNEDDLQKVIDQLEKEKNENAKLTLNLATQYAKKTGKPIKDILDLMKKETWLTADEAKEWGFVDEVYAPGEKVNLFDDLKMVAMIEAAGYPTPKRDTNLNNNMETKKDDNKTLLASIKEQVNKLLSTLSGEKSEEKKDEKKNETPTLEDQIKDLANQVKLISEKVNDKQEEKKDEKSDDKEKTDEKSDKKDEKSDEKANEALVKEIENLKKQIDILAKSEAQDKDLNKETDAGSTKTDDLHASFEKAREFRDIYNL